MFKGYTRINQLSAALAEKRKPWSGLKVLPGSRSCWDKKDKFWLTVGLSVPLTAALFFLPFYIIDGGFFHYAGDFNSQQISFTAI